MITIAERLTQFNAKRAARSDHLISSNFKKAQESRCNR